MRLRRSARGHDWERARLLTPVLAPATPAMVSDGAGPPFAPRALEPPFPDLVPGDPATEALIAGLRRRLPAPDELARELARWRELSRTDAEVLFGRGLPPHLTTVVMRDEGRDGWRSTAVTEKAALRATRDGIRASRWELDPVEPLADADEVLRILVTEQTRSGGAPADARLLTPELHVSDTEVVLTIYVAPKPGIQTPMGARTPQTPVRIQLPAPIGDRDVIDGSLYTAE